MRSPLRRRPPRLLTATALVAAGLAAAASPAPAAELRTELCGSCGPGQVAREARVSTAFRAPGPVALGLYGASGDSVWLDVPPGRAGVRYRLELLWRDGKAFLRMWREGRPRAAAPVAGRVVEGFHPVAAGVLSDVSVDPPAVRDLGTGPARADRGGFAPVQRDIVTPTSYASARATLPRPVLDGDPRWVGLYDRSWRILYRTGLRSPPAGSPLVRTYLDEAFEPDIVFEWDTVFMTMFGRYMQRNFDSAGSLDNWYALQGPTGEIRRVYRESTGEPHPWGAGPDGVNPPLFAWAELESYRLTGDRRRVRRVLPALQAYADWVSISRWSQGTPHRLWWTNGNASGMDNLPRPPGQGGDGTGYGHADMSCQMVLMWRSLAALYDAAGDSRRARESRGLADDAAERINRWLWDAADRRYYDVDASGARQRIDSIAGFWALVSGVARGERARRLVAALHDPRRYWTDMVFPSLSRSAPGFDPTGAYWRGGVWAPTTYATIKGLDAAGYGDVARAATRRYLRGLDEAARYSGTLWEAYAPLRQPAAWLAASRTGGRPVAASALDPARRYVAPASNARGPAANGAGGTDNVVKPDFVGWTGLGPIALLIEDVIGIHADTPRRTIAWTLTRTDRHGVRNLWLGRLGRVSLIAAAREHTGDPVSLKVSSTARVPLRLVVLGPRGRHPLRIAPGASGQRSTLRP